MKKPIVITMGDPSGVGPEIILSSLEKRRQIKTVITGSYEIISKLNERLKLYSGSIKKITDFDQYEKSYEGLQILDPFDIDYKSVVPGKVQVVSGETAFQSVILAIKLCMDKKCSAMVTGPLNKEAIHKAGHMYAGHTEILADYTNTKNYAMLLYEKRLSVIHVTTHVSLLEMITNLNEERIKNVIRLGHSSMKNLLGKYPRIAVAGLNPHAGESGLFGSEEIEIIEPAIAAVKEEGIDVSGPIAPDTVFLRTLEGEYDLVVAMYHDQGHIPLKLLGFHSGINITVGLPIIRTSVDHGTAFDRAWKGKASDESMIEAIDAAIKLSDLSKKEL